MKIGRVDIFSYALPLVQPLRLKDHVLTERTGFLLRLESDSGAAGWGEVAPLPGFSAESADKIRSELGDLRRLLPGRELPPKPTSLTGQFHQWPTSRWWANSIHCGLEMAVLNLLASHQTVPLARLLTERPLETIHINGLIVDPDNVTETVRRLHRDGYRAIKLKVGRGEIETDIERTRDAFHELGSATALRLDANRAWSYDDAIRFARGITDCEIEYIEEPLSESTRLGEYSEQTGLPVALDESLAHLTPAQLADLAFVKAVVLKPTLLGGFDRAAAFARAARRHNMKVVISSCFESSVGIAALAQLAAAFDTFNTPAGLDTLDWFQCDLLIEPIDCSHGRMRIGQLARVAADVNLTMLTEAASG